jgi:WD40 repeat protein
VWIGRGRLAYLSGVIGLAFSGVVMLEEGSSVENDGKERPFAQVAEDQLDAQVASLAFAPGGAELASATVGGDVWVKNRATNHSFRLESGGVASAQSLAFSPDGRVLAVAGVGPAVRLWDVERGRELPALEAGQSGTHRVAFSADGALLAVSGRGGQSAGGLITLWDWSNQRRLGTLEGHRGGITALAFSRAGSLLATGDSKGVVKLWNPAQKRERMSLRADDSLTIIQAVALSPDGALLATVGFLKRDVRLWKTASGQPQGAVPGSPLGVNALAFSADGAILALAGEEGKASLWHLAEHREVGTVRSRGGSFRSLSFSDDNRVLATGGVDGRVCLWDLAQALSAESNRGP